MPARKQQCVNTYWRRDDCGTGQILKAHCCARLPGGRGGGKGGKGKRQPNISSNAIFQHGARRSKALGVSRRRRGNAGVMALGAIRACPTRSSAANTQGRACRARLVEGRRRRHLGCGCVSAQAHRPPCRVHLCLVAKHGCHEHLAIAPRASCASLVSASRMYARACAIGECERNYKANFAVNRRRPATAPALP